MTREATADKETQAASQTTNLNVAVNELKFCTQIVKLLSKKYWNYLF